ncbi:MAG TPA: copper resistance protein NlpE N-terminal domain-containing protein [Candidatus Baltobacteraceae bacterium]
MRMETRTSLARRGILAIALACALSFGMSQTTVRAYLVPGGDFPVDGKYAGVLVCADCAGVWTEVTLVDPSAGGLGSGTFVMTERFTGGVHRGDSITTHGAWSIKFEKEPFSGKMQLRPESSHGKQLATRYFFCEGGRELDMLDARGLAVSATQGTLQRIVPPPRPDFGPIMESDSRSTIFGIVGDTFAVDLPASENSWDWTLAKRTSNGVALVYRDGTSLPPRTGFFTEFILKAVTSGRVRVAFRSSTDPAKTIWFSFVIAH